MIFGRNKEKNQNSGNNNYSNNSNNSNNYYDSDRYSRGSDYSPNNNSNYYDWNLNDSSDNSDSSQNNFYNSSSDYPSWTADMNNNNIPDSYNNNNQPVQPVQPVQSEQVNLNKQYYSNAQSTSPVDLRKNNIPNNQTNNENIDTALPHLNANGTPRNFQYIQYSDYDIPKNFNAEQSNSKISGCVFLLWFFGSMLLMILTADRYPSLTLSLFGQMFLFLGIFLFKQSKDIISKAIMSVFVAVGAACTLMGLVQTFGTGAIKVKAEEIFVFLGLLLFLAVGVGLIVIPIYSANAHKRKCTYSITAYITDIQSRRHEGTTTKAPVYQYVYNGVTYTKASTLYTSGIDFPRQAGEAVTLLIDPDDPDDFYEIGRETHTFTLLTIMGIFFTLMSLSAIVAYLGNIFSH